MARIVFFTVTPLSFGGGFETFIQEFSSYCQAAGHDIEIVSPPLSQFKYAVSLLGLGRRFAHLTETGHSKKRYQDAIRSADVVYVKNEILDLVWINAIAASKSKVIGFHTRIKSGSPFRDALYQSSLYKRLLNRMPLHFVDSSPIGMFPKNRFVVVPNGIRFPDRLADHSKKKNVILYAGRLSNEKGSDRLRTIAATLPEGYRLIVAGDGPDESDVRKSLSESKSDIVGRIDRNELSSLYANAKILVLPSRLEIVPFALIEAIAAGVVPLCQDIPALRGLLEPWPQLLCDFDDIDSIRDGIERAMDFIRTGSMSDLFGAFKERYSSQVVYHQLLDFLLAQKSSINA